VPLLRLKEYFKQHSVLVGKPSNFTELGPESQTASPKYSFAEG
jgi:hypothetical protein